MSVPRPFFIQRRSLWAGKFRSENPLQEPAALTLDEADDPAIAKLDDMPLGISHQQHRGQAAEMRKVADKHEWFDC